MQVRGYGARAFDRRADAARERDVVIFYQHAVVESEAVIAPAAGLHRVLLQHTQARRRLARIHDLRARAFDRFDKLARQRGDAGETLQEIQSRALAAQEHVREAARAGDDLTGFDLVAVGDEGFELLLRVERREDRFGGFESGDDHRFFRYEASARLRVAGHGRLRRDVAAP